MTSHDLRVIATWSDQGSLITNDWLLQGKKTVSLRFLSENRDIWRMRMFRREELLMTLVDYLLREFITHLLREGEKLVQMGSNSLFLIGHHGKSRSNLAVGK